MCYAEYLLQEREIGSLEKEPLKAMDRCHSYCMSSPLIENNSVLVRAPDFKLFQAFWGKKEEKKKKEKKEGPNHEKLFSSWNQIMADLHETKVSLSYSPAHCALSNTLC